MSSSSSLRDLPGKEDITLYYTRKADRRQAIRRKKHLKEAPGQKGLRAEHSDKGKYFIAQSEPGHGILTQPRRRVALLLLVLASGDQQEHRAARFVAHFRLCLLHLFGWPRLGNSGNRKARIKQRIHIGCNRAVIFHHIIL